jgi:hypothetical protein
MFTFFNTECGSISYKIIRFVIFKPIPGFTNDEKSQLAKKKGLAF